MSTNDDLLEFVNPAKLCVAVWIRDHVMALRNYDDPSDLLALDVTGKHVRIIRIEKKPV